MIPQALLVGRPVISYDIDGAREVVLPQTGILLKPRDLAGLARRHPHARGRSREAGRHGPRGPARFAEQFRHETMTRQLRDLYQRLRSSRLAGRLRFSTAFVRFRFLAIASFVTFRCALALFADGNDGERKRRTAPPV